MNKPVPLRLAGIKLVDTNDGNEKFDVTIDFEVNANTILYGPPHEFTNWLIYFLEHNGDLKKDVLEHFYKQRFNSVVKEE